MADIASVPARCDMRDLHAGGLQREDAGPRAFRVCRQVDQEVEVVVVDALCGFAVGQRSHGVEPLEQRLVALGPSVATFARRIAEDVEARRGRDAG